MDKSIKVTYSHQADTEYKVVNAFVEEFLNGFNKVSGKEINSARFRNTLPFVRKAILELRTLFENSQFDKNLDEAYFFKHVKPLIYSYLISEIELSRIFLNNPEILENSDATYYSSFTEKYRKFFVINNFQYRYYKSQSTEFDDLLFVRRKDISLTTIDYSVLSDPGFSTMLDPFFAKFMAFERVQDVLKDLTRCRSSIRKEAPGDTDITHNSLTWTGEAINLVEVAYGIWLTGQINNGEASISEIIHWLETGFKLKIGRAYRRWTEISRRKLISSTRYLDQMKDSINKRIEDENDLKANRRRSTRNRGG
ncbi:RteC domain-containing protein [Mucilaginibacter jinjuensis]|uniref:RteC domain-containing protein n=1 Tax=Mucilaginibacter jinjuensis TaxID=1176721 RepID=A0ABY7TBA9_9SPHI|nr:RteC domain-containing protein [Mucilaginibacter jinjuensis]WCT13800.1 RteC domain-containing protein [Mucilaginibacter jinjuensis]